MKSLLPIFLVLCLMCPVAAQPAVSAKAPAAPPVSSVKSPLPANSLTPEEWKELTAARQKALKDNPEIRGEFAGIEARIHDFQDKLHAAMIKANPRVAPTIARLEKTASRPTPIQVPAKDH